MLQIANDLYTYMSEVHGKRYSLEAACRDLHRKRKSIIDYLMEDIEEAEDEDVANAAQILVNQIANL